MEQKEIIAPRISILDAGELDGAIFGILKSQTNLAVKYLPAWILNKYSLELDTFLRILIWKLSVGKHKSTFGQQLLHLKYSNKTSYQNLRTLGFLTIGVPYLKEKYLNSLHHQEGTNPQTVRDFFDRIESILKLIDILTFVRFLYRGGPSSFLELLLNVKPISTVPQSRRNIGYVYMTRELIWHGFMELLMVFLPLVNYYRLQRYISKIFSVKKNQPQSPKRCIFTSRTLCEICKEPPIIPHQMGCSHAFCYSCLAAHRLADEKYECPGCGFSDPDPNAFQPVPLVSGNEDSDTDKDAVWV